MADLENTDFDDILDQWCQKHPYGYRWEGDAGVRNFEQLTKDLGYDYGIENFLADNPGAIETLLTWISEHAEKGGSEWKENLAKSCDYEEEADKEEDEETEETEEEKITYVVEHSDGTRHGPYINREDAESDADLIDGIVINIGEND